MFVDQFVDWAHQGLLESEEAQSYLTGRGVSRDQWSRHRLGFISGDFDVDPGACPGHSDVCSDWEKKHLWCDACRYRRWSSTWEQPEGGDRKVQIVGRRLHGCVVFPLTSYSNTSIGFQIRSITKKEYDTFALQRRPEGYFFGCQMNFQEVWATKEVVLVEGPGDHLIVERLAAPNVLGLTTSGLSKSQLRYLRRFVKRVYMCLDLDVAGRNGVKTFIERNGSDFDIVDVKYPRVGPNDKDPGDLWRRVGDDRFRSVFHKALGTPQV